MNTTLPGPADETPPTVERRSVPRHHLIQRCIARPDIDTATDGWRCIAYNISATGIGVALPLPLKRGAVLWIEPWNLPGGRAMQTRVVHTRPLEFVWLCGCEFLEPLPDAELQAWLARAVLPV
jgi:PilZ domain